MRTRIETECSRQRAKGKGQRAKGRRGQRVCGASPVGMAPCSILFFTTASDNGLDANAHAHARCSPSRDSSSSSISPDSVLTVGRHLQSGGVYLVAQKAAGRAARWPTIASLCPIRPGHDIAIRPTS